MRHLIKIGLSIIESIHVYGNHLLLNTPLLIPIMIIQFSVQLHNFSPRRDRKDSEDTVAAHFLIGSITTSI
jgi:hypothetical protein